MRRDADERAANADVECSVWWATPRLDPRLVELLSPDERERALRLGQTAQGARYVTGRALARLALRARTNSPAAAVRFDTTCRHCGGDHGKPLVSGPSGQRGPAFNIAHTPGRVVLAVSDGPDVGVDVETVRNLAPQQLATLAADILSEDERRAYDRLPTSDRAHAIVVWWTRKEAVLKATGEGLAIPPCRLTVTGPGLAPAVTAWDPRTSWPSAVAPVARLQDLEAGASLVACVAVLSSGRLTVREHDGDSLLAEVAAPRTAQNRRS